MRPASVATRMIVAVGLESAWEVYENTDTVVERYRRARSRSATTATAHQLAADIVACLVGFLLAWRLPRAATIAWVIAVEIVLAFWIRDNLTLNIIMLIYPIRAVKTWQAAGLGISSLGSRFRVPGSGFWFRVRG